MPLPPHPIPLDGDGAAPAIDLQDLIEVDEVEIWWEDNFRRPDQVGLGTATGRFADDPTERYKNPYWASYETGVLSPDPTGGPFPVRSALTWDYGNGDPGGVNEIRDEAYYAFNFTSRAAGMAVPGLYLFGEWAVAIQVQADFDEVDNTGWTSIGQTNANDGLGYYVQLNHFEIRYSRSADPEGYFFGVTSATGSNIDDPTTEGTFTEWAAISPQADDVVDMWYGFRRLPAVDTGELGVHPHWYAALGIAGSSGEREDQGVPTRALMRIELLDDEIGAPDMDVTRPEETTYESFPAINMAHFPGASSNVFRVRMFVPPSGPYKGASFYARRRPGSPVIDLDDNPWENIDAGSVEAAKTDPYGRSGPPGYRNPNDPSPSSPGPTRGV